MNLIVKNNMHFEKCHNRLFFSRVCFFEVSLYHHDVIVIIYIITYYFVIFLNAFYKLILLLYN